MAQRSVQSALKIVPNVSDALSRASRACALARAAATSGAIAVREQREELAGARVARCEGLLVVAREALTGTKCAVGEVVRTLQLEEGVEEGARKRWDTPPEEWWNERRVALEGRVTKVRDTAVALEKKWDGARDGEEYEQAVKAMADGIAKVLKMWDDTMEDSREWREIADAVGDGIPASHSVARRFHV